MTASTEWNGRKKLTGGYIDVDREGTKDEELTSREFMKKCALRRRFPKPDSGSDPDDGNDEP